MISTGYGKNERPGEYDPTICAFTELKFNSKQKAKIFKRDGYKCAICGASKKMA